MRKYSTAAVSESLGEYFVFYGDARPSGDFVAVKGASRFSTHQDALAFARQVAERIEDNAKLEGITHANLTS